MGTGRNISPGPYYRPCTPSSVNWDPTPLPTSKWLSTSTTRASQQTGQQILVTDTLDHEPPQLRLDVMNDPVAEEGQQADRLKRSERFTVVIGNPPWRRQTSEAGDDTEDRQGGIVRYGAAGLTPLIKDVTRPLKAAGLGRLTVNVYNLYVYFWRWAIWQATQLPLGPGVVAFITASSYLEGLSMGGLRSLLRDTFDEIVIVNLGGEGRGAVTEENIFDIQTPAAVAFGVRTGAQGLSCTVRYKRISGTRQEMFDQLDALSLTNVTTEVPGQGIERFVPHRSDSVYWEWGRSRTCSRGAIRVACFSVHGQLVSPGISCGGGGTNSSQLFPVVGQSY